MLCIAGKIAIKRRIMDRDTPRFPIRLCVLVCILAGLLLFIALPRSFFVVQPENVEEICVPPRQVPKVPDYRGEGIKYDIKLGPVRVGTASFRNVELTKIEGDIPASLVTFETKLAKFQDLETIYAQPETFLPLRVDRDIRTWPKHEKIREEYDQSAYRLTISKPGSAPATVIKKDAPIHNAILLPYFVRKIPGLDVGWKFLINLPTQQFTLKALRVEQVTVPAGTFSAYYLTSDPERFEIWITADARRIPVRIRGSGAVGYTMLMREYIPPAGIQSVAGSAIDGAGS